MWKKVQINGSEFLMKHDISGTKHKVYVTNLVHLWLEEILEEILLQRCKVGTIIYLCLVAFHNSHLKPLFSYILVK